jgi:dihydropteroate synthase
MARRFQSAGFFRTVDPVANIPDTPLTWRFARDRSLTLDRARVIAILNITPDSFSDGGRIAGVEDAVAAAHAAIADGADMLDIGGESTRPGARAVGDAEQIDRVVPVILAIRASGIARPISVDTTRSGVARAALDAGADAVNDVSAGTDDPAMLALLAERGAGVILMHRLRRPNDDSWSDRYDEAPAYPGGVVGCVCAFLLERAAAAMAAGIDREAIAIDPGLGFGKSVPQNLALIAATARFVATGYPVVGAASRKSFLGAVTGVENPSDRVASSIAASVAQRLGGAPLFRVHDVLAQSHGLRIADAIHRDEPS